MVSRWPELVRLCYALTGDRWLAEDLAQTALAGACTAWWRVRRADESALRRRLREEVDLAEISPAPVEVVFRRRRAVRARRLALVSSGAAVIAAAAGVLAVSPGRTLHAPHGRAGGGVFASGTAHGRVWRLAAVNLADPGYRCLPGIVVNGQNGDLLQPGFAPGLALGNVAFWASYPGRPAAGYAFLQPPPAVR